MAPDSIARELDAGERVLWSGKPDPNRMWRKAIPTALSSIPGGICIVFLMWGASTSARSALSVGKMPDIISVALLFFLLIFTAFIILRALSPWTEAARARRTFYALTNRRALVVVEGGNKSVESVSPTEFSLECLDLGQKGDVVLKRETTGTGRNKSTVETGFFGIDNPHEVERLACELALTAR